MDTELLSFAEAVTRSAGSARHVLLGNGFSIACRPDCFRYEALLEEATFEDASTDLRRLFELLGTTDFERVIELLRRAADICEGYAPQDSNLCARLRADAQVVREALARVLASRHPDYSFDISMDEYQCTKNFLASFERIYTLNYDMLLYWTLMQDGEPYLARNDGFGNPDDEDSPYVVWKPYDVYTTQRVFYLHGGLHLYDSGLELAKITWTRTNIPLVEQIRGALNEGRYPLIVTEGTSEEKLTRILHNAYLNHAIRSFSRITGALFMFGLSLMTNDDHLLRRIAEGRLSAVYVSLYGDPRSTPNLEVIGRAHALAIARSSTRPLAVHFFDASSAHVWS